MSLKEDLETIVQHAKYNAVIFTGLDTDGAKANTDFEVEAILTTISKYLPGNPWTDKLNATHDMPKSMHRDLKKKQQGYNQAIDEVNKLLTTNKKEEV